MIEVKQTHLLRLNHCVYAIVRDAKAAEKRLQNFCDEKFLDGTSRRDRGYRLRFIPDYAGGFLDIQDDKRLNVDMGLRQLKDAGLLIKVAPWREVEIHKRTRNKVYTGV